MARKTFTLYDGHEWMQVIADEKTPKSGHYEEISRTFLNIFGIFDDYDVMTDAIAQINEYASEMGSSYYWAKGWGEPYIFSSYALTPQHSSLGGALIETLRQTGVCQPLLYERITIKNIDSFHLKIYDRSVRKEFDIYLQPLDVITFSI